MSRLSKDPELGFAVHAHHYGSNPLRIVLVARCSLCERLIAPDPQRAALVAFMATSIAGGVMGMVWIDYSPTMKGGRSLLFATLGCIILVRWGALSKFSVHSWSRSKRKKAKVDAGMRGWP